MLEKIRTELKDAMRAKDEVRVNTLRGIIAATTNEMISKGKTPQDIPTDEEVLAVIKRLVKQRKDSIDQFQKGGRTDLADKEVIELKILEVYLPAQMPREEIEKIAKEMKEKMNVSDKSKMGQLMGAVMKETKGNADGIVVKEIVESLFS
jgi:uncharacterized protein YqeY